MKLRILRWVGIVTYLSSYFLPAIGNPDQHPMRVMRGWACATFSIWFGLGGFLADLTPEGRRSFISLLLPGLTNPLLFFYIVLALKDRGIRLRKILTVLIFVFAATTPIAFHLMPFAVLIGVYVWLAGMAITVCPELIMMIGELRLRWADRKSA
jgi:hypothetical protein